MTSVREEVTAGGEERSIGYAWRVVSVVGLAGVLTALGGSALNVALPQVVQQTGASAAAASWILLSFQLTTTTLMVAFGRMADMFGRRAMYLGGLATYTAASLLAGFAPDPWLIVALRVFQAAGTAMLLTNSAALITDAFPRARLGEGMGVYTACFSIAQLIGPTMGGFLAEHLGWRWVFWYNVPIGVGCLAWDAYVLRRTRPRQTERGMDWPGNLLVLLCLGGLLIALSEVSRRGWHDPLILAGLAGFAVTLPLFLLVELRHRRPVVDLRMFRQAAFALGTAASFLASCARVAVVLLLALFFQAVHGDDPVTAGLKILPLAVAAMVASAGSGFLQRRLSARTLAAAGSGLVTLGLLALLATISPDAPYPLLGAALLVIGLGSGTFLPSNTVVLMDGMPAGRVGIANAMRLMLQNTGIVVGTALALSIITAPLPADLHDAVFAGTLHDVSGPATAQLALGYRWALACMAAVSALCTLTCLGRRRAGRRAAAGR
ncbi:EmrB/QacA subfamily drug resistance transporter [Thermocatellispora tengchongensis]|uniref:EmrB/QacA subfamily drug resistance transporter n=1 Tax=Thermocatellispora tengchongensis TaxID=1073253 RepID=A0A840PDL7_9ACTN|nr:MFS transporter [Thermocatellispora tengchongensis]MBB5135941.1 EmrB/QacA subfamily drug resistance transporter [Thermocatellispora tengchongensis]